MLEIAFQRYYIQIDMEVRSKGSVGGESVGREDFVPKLLNNELGIALYKRLMQVFSAKSRISIAIAS